MADKSDFAARIARIEANAGKPAVPVTPGPVEHTAKYTKPKRHRPLFPRLMRTTFGLIGIAFAAGMTLNEMDTTSLKGSVFDVSYLEQMILGQMGEDEIAQINTDPALDGKSQMEKLLLSN